jgi:hypothetical protein
MQHSEGKVAEGEGFAVPCHVYGKAGFGAGSVNDGGACGLAQVNVAADEISVEMRLENILDAGIALLGKLEVHVNITEGIHYSRFAVAFDIISGFAQTAGVQLLQEHKKIFGYKITPFATKDFLK